MPTHYEELPAKVRAYWEMKVAGVSNRQQLVENIEAEEQDVAIMMYRSAGKVRRCHTFDHVGHYDVGHHSWQALTLLYLLYPGSPSANLVQAVLWHDVGEYELGDLPAPAKWHNPKLHEIYAATERGVLEKHYKLASKAIEALNEEERAWLRGVDRLELVMWCADQAHLGNRFAVNVQTRVLAMLQKEPPPKEIVQYMQRIAMKNMTTTEEQ